MRSADIEPLLITFWQIYAISELKLTIVETIDKIIVGQFQTRSDQLRDINSCPASKDNSSRINDKNANAHSVEGTFKLCCIS